MAAATLDKPETKPDARMGSTEWISEDKIHAHQARMAQRREERRKRLPEQIRCLDAEHAANKEAEKPRFRYAIKCVVQEHDPKLKRMVPVEKSGEVDAQNEADAWAIFCDKFSVRTGPAHCNRDIKKIGKRANELQEV